jgi:hypothetical protein
MPLRYPHHSHSFTDAKAYASANRETTDLDARVQTILTPGDEDDVDAIRRERRTGDRTLAALQIDGYSNTFKSPSIVGINSVTVG